MIIIDNYYCYYETIDYYHLANKLAPIIITDNTTAFSNIRTKIILAIVVKKT